MTDTTEPADAGETIRQLRAENQRLRRQVSRFEAMTMQDFGGFVTTRAMQSINKTIQDRAAMKGETP